MTGEFERLVAERSHPSKASIKRLVNLIQEAYTSQDIIISSLDADQLIRTVDNIYRAFFVSLDRADNTYVFGKLLLASTGLAVGDRKRIFIEHRLLVNVEREWRDGGYAEIVFSFVGDRPYLLISHVFGAGLLNDIESVLRFVQTTYLQELGFSMGTDSLEIWIQDVGNYHYRLRIDDTFENLEWTEMDAREFAKLRRHILERTTVDVRFFKKGTEYTAYKHVRSILEATRRHMLIVDPYVNDSTIEMLEAVSNEVNVRFLCTKLQGDASVLARKFARERGKAEFRITSDIHDRYLFCDGHGYILGASLNRFGSKASTIVRMGDTEVVQQIQHYFDGIWRQSKPLGDR